MACPNFSRIFSCMILPRTILSIIVHTSRKKIAHFHVCLGRFFLSGPALHSPVNHRALSKRPDRVLPFHLGFTSTVCFCSMLSCQSSRLVDRALLKRSECVLLFVLGEVLTVCFCSVLLFQRLNVKAAETFRTAAAMYTKIEDTISEVPQASIAHL